MVIPLVNYNRVLDVLGKPQTIKGINFYPIKLLDAESRNLFDNIFMFSRSQMFHINDIECLERKIEYPWINVFLSQYQKALNPKGIDSFIMLQKMLSLVCHIDMQDVAIGFKDKSYVYDCDSVLEQEIIVQITTYIKDEEFEKKKFIQFSGEEFNEIRGTIIEQNGKSVEYIDEWNASFEEDVERYLKSQTEKQTFTSFSDDIITYKELSEKSNEEFEQLTLFQFYKGYEKAKQIKDYEIYYPLEAIGKIKFSKKLVHYSRPLERQGRYDFLRLSWEEFNKTDLMKNMKNK